MHLLKLELSFFSRYISRSGIAGSCGHSSFSMFFKEPPYSFPQWLHQFAFPPIANRVPFSLHPHPSLLFVFFLMILSLKSVRCHLTVVYVCISLMISDTEHLFMCLLSICISSLEKYLVISAHFLISLFDFLMLNCMSCLYTLGINPLLVMCVLVA